MNKVTFGEEAFKKLLKGLDTVADAVSSTMGPRGRNVYISDVYTPRITNDGFTVANRIVLEDKEEDMGAYIIRNVSSKQNDQVGDGTTTVSLLTQTIIHECLKRPENPIEVESSLKEAAQRAMKAFSKQAIKLKPTDVKRVALISGENEELATAIDSLIEKLGNKAHIDIIDSPTSNIETEIGDGYETKVGFMSEGFINDEKAQKAVHFDIPVLVTEKKITNAIDVSPLFKQLKDAGHKSCAIVCDDISDDMLGAFVLTYRKRMMDLVVIRAMGDKLKDIEGAVGATAVSDANGISFQNVELKHLGLCKKLVCDKNKTVFLGNGIKGKIRASELEKQAAKEPNQFVRKMIEDRAHQLRGSVGILKIGASTDLEREYLKDKATDAVKAVQAALESGIVEGGGLALWRVSKQLTGKTIGEQILKKALKAPLKKIIENAGIDFEDIDLSGGQGYDAKNKKYGNLIELGIIDPAKVELCALDNAVSAAGKCITTNVLITELNEKK